jgi:hypothetical protein
LGNEFCKEVFALNNVDAETRIEMICASASVPVFFGTFSVNGEAYVDGGWEDKGGDNVPIGPILDNHPEIKTIIVVYLKDENHIKPAQRDRVRGAAKKKCVRLVEIIPSEDIGGGLGGWGGLFDASPETARRLIELGRKDARKVLAEAGMTAASVDGAGAGAAGSGGFMALAAASGPAIAAIAAGAAISYCGYVVYDHYKGIELVNGEFSFNEKKSCPTTTLSSSK